MKRTFVIAILIALFILSTVLMDSASSQDKPIVLKLGHAVAPEHPYHLGAVKYAELAWIPMKDEEPNRFRVQHG
jgi:TRAP-type C4-dicarboxylate transport system substrate-binding protein